VNEFGFIESPYRKVNNGKVSKEIVYLAADEEEDYTVAQANAPLNDDSTFKEDRVLARRSPQGASLSDLKLQLERDIYFAATTEITSLTRGDFADVVVEIDDNSSLVRNGLAKASDQPQKFQMMDVSPKQIVP